MFHNNTSTMHCDTKKFTILELYTQRNSIDENPPYQRESAVWSPQKMELFIDSLINSYDVPKIYFHDLRGAKKKGLKKYAIIDGKQRLYAIYEFLKAGGISLAKDFKIQKDTEYESVKPLMKFEDLSETDQAMFSGTSLDIVLVKDANEDDIEELFFRLNNGEPLNGAEKRNNIPGRMNELIREMAKNVFFTDKIKFKNTRYSHLEVAAKFILLENNHMNGGAIYSDLKKKFLDKMVDDNRNMQPGIKSGLAKRLEKNLNVLAKVFQDKDPLLSKQGYPPLYYIFVKLITSEYGHDHLHSRIRAFIESFQVARVKDLELPEDDRDGSLSEFTRLMQQGTNDLMSLINRVSILRRFFLEKYADVIILDAQRHFTDEERFAIYILGGKQCAECLKPLTDIKEMEADHHRQWAFGGATTLENGRSLCQDCNIKAKVNVK